MGSWCVAAPSYLAALKEQLVQTDRILETAQAQGWTRQTEMNQRVRDNLLTVITALETNDQAVIVGGRVPPQSVASFVPLNHLRADVEANINGTSMACVPPLNGSTRKPSSGLTPPDVLADLTSQRSIGVDKIGHHADIPVLQSNKRAERTSSLDGSLGQAAQEVALEAQKDHHDRDAHQH